LDRIAILPSAVLINGETGTGKELVARTIHDRSPRRSNPFVAVNCAALPAELLESELFGYEKGAFTGAKAAKKGLFEAADGGTIFLDEIGELRVDLQAKLLRVLQERSFIKIGGTKETKVDVRLIAATHRNLPQRIKEGHFREDLYYRLNAFQIYVPPLRERLEDISVLARNLTKRWSTIFGTQIELDDDVVGYLKTYDYPGNVREFENVIQRIVGLVSAQHPTVDEIKAIEAFPFCPSVDELLHETSMERKPVRDRDHYADLMADALRSLLPRIGTSLELRSEASIVRAARQQVLREYSADRYPDTASYVIRLVGERHPEVAKAVEDALKQLKEKRRIARSGNLES